MTTFIDGVNHASSVSVLGKVALAHIYFESIHPFEDENGRIGRALVEKMLSQSLGREALVAMFRELERRRKEYYTELGKCNRTLIVQDWVEFFVQMILKAQKEAMKGLHFLSSSKRRSY